MVEIRLKEVVSTSFTIFGTFYLFLYTYEGFLKVYGGEITVAVRSDSSFDYQMPYITLCPRYFDSLAVGIGDSVLPQMSLSNALTNGRSKLEATYISDPTKVAKMYRFHHGGLRSGSLMFEPCYTFLNNSRNGAAWIDFNMTNVADVFMVFQKSLGGAPLLMSLDNGFIPYFESQIKGKEQKSRTIQLELEVTRLENRHETSLCVLDQRKVDSNCMEKTIQTVLDCKLPWDTFDNSSYSRYCNSRDDFYILSQYMRDVRTLNITEEFDYFISDLGCTRLCDEENYNFRVVLDDKFEQKNNVSLHIDINMKKKDIRVVTERINYDAFVMIADVGGFTGFLLGYSFLTVYDFFLDFFANVGVLRRLFSKNREDENN